MLAYLQIKDNIVYRLANDNGSYEAIGSLTPITIHFLELPLSAPIPRKARAGLSLIPIQLGSDAAAGVIPYQLFYCLYSAIAIAGKWWPLEEVYWHWRVFFAKQSIYLLCDRERLVGFTCVEEIEPDQKTKINFVGILPSAQGKGYGSYLFSEICHRSFEQGVKVLQLDTAPEYDIMADGTSALSMYLKKGFVEYQAPQTVCPSSVLNNPDSIAFGINQFNLPAYYDNNPLCDVSALEQKIELLWQEVRGIIILCQ